MTIMEITVVRRAPSPRPGPERVPLNQLTQPQLVLARKLDRAADRRPGRGAEFNSSI